jgi:hypothetical protein
MILRGKKKPNSIVGGGQCKSFGKLILSFILFTMVYFATISLCCGFHIFARFDKLTGFLPCGILNFQ